MWAMALPEAEAVSAVCVGLIAALLACSTTGGPPAEAPLQLPENAVARRCYPTDVSRQDAVVTFVWKNPSPGLDVSFSPLDDVSFCSWGYVPSHRHAFEPKGNGFGLYVYAGAKWAYFEDDHRCRAGGRLTITIETRLAGSGELTVAASYSDAVGCFGQRGMTERRRSGAIDVATGLPEPPLHVPCCSEKTPVAGEE
jgi:hypothetical protein